MGHSPYSPNLAPNDFFLLFSQIRTKLRWHRFLSPEEDVDVFKNHVLEMFQAEWRKCYDILFERIQKSEKQ